MALESKVLSIRFYWLTGVFESTKNMLVFFLALGTLFLLPAYIRMYAPSNFALFISLVFNGGLLVVFWRWVSPAIYHLIKFISDFEETATELAIQNKFDYVICGHIHQPTIRKVSTEKGNCTYLNSGDWIENLSFLEYDNKEWSLKYHTASNTQSIDPLDAEENIKDLDKILTTVRKLS